MIRGTTAADAAVSSVWRIDPRRGVISRIRATYAISDAAAASLPSGAYVVGGVRDGAPTADVRVLRAG